MYSDTLSSRDRAGPVTGVILVHLVLGAMLLGISGHFAPVAVQQTLKLFNVHEAPPPPPPPRRRPKPKPRPKPAPVKSSAGAAPNKKSEATPVVAPKPRLVVPAPTQVVASATPQQATAQNPGDAPNLGNGAGTGGAGSGTGGSGSGNGNGADGNDVLPRPLFKHLGPRFFPRQMTETLPFGRRVLVIFDVLVDGRIADCTVRESSGEPELDATVCQLAQQRFRYEPAHHGDGTLFVAKMAYVQAF